MRFDLSEGLDEERMNGGFGPFGYTTISGKVWQDVNFDGILNETETGLAGKSLTLTQWYLDDKGTSETTDDEWVKVTDFNATGSVTTTTDDGTTLDLGEYAFGHLPSFVYVKDGKVYQPGTRGVTDAAGALIDENDLGVTTDDLHMTSYRLTLSEVAPSFSLTTAHVGINVETDAFTVDTNGVITNRTTSSVFADRPGTGVNETQGLEDRDSDAIRTGDDFGTIEIREEFFDGVVGAWRRDGYVLVSDHADLGDGHQYEHGYGPASTGTVSYDVPDRWSPSAAATPAW